MFRPNIEGSSEEGAAPIIRFLTTRQHLYPHWRLREVLDAAGDDLGICPARAVAAMRWLQLDENRAIGRLRRGELLQLAQCIARLQQPPQASPNAPSAERPIRPG